jgi:hypothetical protein
VQLGGHYDKSSGWRSAQDARFYDPNTMKRRSPIQVDTSSAYEPKNMESTGTLHI